MTPKQVGPEAAAELARLHALAFEGTGERTWSEAELRALLEQPQTLALLHEGAGFLLARRAAGEAEILTLAVAPTARQQGLGGGLIDAALAFLEGEGVQRTVLEVAADNRAALELYAGRGFRPVGRRPNYYSRRGSPDAVVLARDDSGGARAAL